MKTIPLFLSIAIIVVFTSTLFAQPPTERMMRVNTTSVGLLDNLEEDYPWLQSAFLSNGKVAVITHEVGLTTTDMKLYLVDTDGSIDWEKTIDLGEAEHGIRLVVDANDHIYALGTGFSLIDDQNVLLYKYNASGTLLWTLNWDAGNNLGDLPADLQVDAGGEAYVTGLANRGNESTTSDDDVFLIKVDNTGTVSWSSFYDHNGYNDGGLTVLLDGTYAYVAANSHSSASVRNRTLLKYNKSTGTQQGSAKRESSSSNEYWTDMEWLDGDLLAVGRQNMDAVITCYNPTNLTQNWETTHDGFGYGNEAYNLAVSGTNAYVGCHSDNENPARIGFNLWIDTSGTILSKHRLEDRNEKGFMTVKEVASFNGDVAFLMEQGDTNHQESFVLFYESGLQSIRTYQCAEGFRAVDMAVKNHELFITGYEESIGGKKAKFERIETKSFYIDNELDTAGGDSFYYHTNLVGALFTKNAIKLEAIDDLKVEYGKLTDFLTQADADDIHDSTDISLDSLWIFKGFRSQTSSDTTDTSFAGRAFKTYPYYRSLRIVLPGSAQIETVVEQLESLDGVQMAWRKQLPQTLHSMEPNDGNFWKNYQFSLWSNHSSSRFNSLNLSDQSIRILEAWKMSTGRPEIKVAIVEAVEGIKDKTAYGALMQYNHEDLSLRKNFGTSVIKGGAYTADLSIDKATGRHFSTHAATTGGFVGAIRNNKKGVAGIAGGTGSSLNGVSLYSYKYGNENLKDAIDEGVHIINQSFAGGYTSEGYNIYLDAYRKGILMVSGRGNRGFNEITFPATELTDFTMSVSGSGDDGKYRKPSNSGASWDKKFLNYGMHMDVLAPGAPEINMSTGVKESAEPGDSVFAIDLNNTNQYDISNHTSMATPHVSGVAALLASAHYSTSGGNTTLYPEDMEHLIQLGAIDLDQNDEDPGLLNPKGTEGRPMPTKGYDELTGWGRLDATYTAYYASEPNFKILHFHEGHADLSNTQITITKVATLDTFQFLEFLQDGIDSTFLADQYRIDISSTYSLPNKYVTFRLADYPDGGAWALPAASNLMSPESYSANSGYGLSKYQTCETIPYLARTNINKVQNRITLSGYVYHVKKGLAGSIGGTVNFKNLNHWLPFDTAYARQNVTFGFTVHAADSTANSIETAHTPKFSLYPNPTSQWVQLEMKKSHENLRVEVYNMAGKLWHQQLWPLSQNQMQLNLATFPSGMYYIRVSGAQGQSTQKLVKH